MPVELTSALVVALDRWTGEVEPINILMPIRNPYETTSAQLMMRGINRSKTRQRYDANSTLKTVDCPVTVLLLLADTSSDTKNIVKTEIANEGMKNLYKRGPFSC